MSFNENQHKCAYVQQIMCHNVDLTYNNNDRMRSFICKRFLLAKMQMKENIKISMRIS